MKAISFTIRGFCRGFLMVVLLFGVFLLDTRNSEAQQVEIVKHEFPVVKWNVRAGQHTYVAYGNPDEEMSFNYRGVDYRIGEVREGVGAVRIDIRPSFPPKNLPGGVEPGDFTFHAGVPGSDLNSFRYPRSLQHSIEHLWFGSAGWSEAQKGVIRITVRDKSVADNLRFAASRPDTDSTSTSGRLEFHDNEESMKWRVCNTGFGAQEAKVACRQMGMEIGTAEPVDISTTDWFEYKHPKGSFLRWGEVFELLSIYATPVLLDSIECTGNEDRLADCKHLGFEVQEGDHCPIENTAAVECDASQDESDDPDGDEDAGCPCGKAPNGKCWAPKHCGEGGGFGE